jgi:pimeloyl-ACP methyl ester carboxylesterase
MKRILRHWLLVPIAVSAVVMAAPVQAQTTASTERAAKSKPRVTSSYSNGHVYLLRGLLNIFSLGMDDLAAKIQARGISASVHNHTEWQALADTIATQYRAKQHGPIVLVGHSLGADAVMHMAEYLGSKKVPVALVVPFDGTGSFAASSNVSQVFNVTQRDYAYMRRGAGFRGTLQNYDVSGQGYGHTDIDKSPRLHALVIGRIQGVIRSRGGRQIEEAGAPAPRARPAAAEATSGAAPAAAPATEAPAATAPAKPAAEAAPAASAAPATAAAEPATTASVSADRPAAAKPPAISRPATTETQSRRAPGNSETGIRPSLQF